MLYQQNVDVVDDDLTDEKDNRLQGLRERWRLCDSGLSAQFNWDWWNKAGNNHRSGDGANRAKNTISSNNQSSAHKEARKRFKNKIDAQPGESTDALHCATFHSQRSVSGDAKRKNTDNPGAGDVQVCGNGLLGNKESRTQSEAGDPRLAQKIVDNSGFAGSSLVPGHKFGADQLKRQADT